MSTLTDHLRQRALPPLLGFGRWWLAELRAMLPASLALPFARGMSSVEIHPSFTGVELIRVAGDTGERFVEEKRLEAFDTANWEETGALVAGHRTRVLLQAPLIHVLTLKLPKVARRHLRSAIPLQLRDHAPLLPELLHWTMVDTRLEDETLIVRVVIVRLSTLDTIENGFIGHGFAQPPVLAAIDETRTVMLHRGRRAPGTAQPSWPWIIAIALLLSTPGWIWLARHLLILRERDRIERVEAIAEPRMAAERRLRRKAELGHALNTVLAMPSATAAIETLAAKVPSTAHAVDVAGRDDGALAFTLETTDPDSLRAPLSAGSELPDLHELDQSQTQTGSMRIRYEAKPR